MDKLKEYCVFCRIVSGSIPAKKTDYENFIVFNDANPVSNGHCLIVPKKHFRNLLDLPSSMGGELLGIIKKESLRLIEEGKADGIKVISNNEPSAGQAVFHTHVHIIPEKKGVKREKQV